MPASFFSFGYGLFGSVLLLFTLFVACGPSPCKSNSDCPGTQVCLSSGLCVLVLEEKGKETNTEGSQETPAPEEGIASEPKPEGAKEGEAPPQERAKEAATETIFSEQEDEKVILPELTDGSVGDVVRPERIEEIPSEGISSGACKTGETKACYTGPQGTLRVGACVPGVQECVGGFWDVECKGQVLPASREECNGKDDDCNGQIDEAFPEDKQACTVPNALGPCGSGNFQCFQGVLTCVSPHTKAAIEDCGNGIDDDCDGKIDGPPCLCRPGEKRECYNGPAGTENKGLCIKGQQTCEASGQWSGCIGEILPKSESCNGKDDDCDGSIDEDFPEKGKFCNDLSLKGECQRGIYSACLNATLLCKSTTQPVTEICGNGKDDNCNGSIDEDPPCQCTAGQTRSCYEGPTGTDGVGPCKRGTQTCTAGQWSPCTGQVLPTAETCDGKDNDCDGRIDGGLSRVCSTACGSGKEYCTAGVWGGCDAPAPRAEICDTKDNDCDGQIDENLTQSCSNNCGTGIETCQNGKWVNCTAPGSATETCDNKDNDCDGKVDENLTRPCYPSQTAGCTEATGQWTCIGLCKTGTQTCTAGQWSTGCTAPVVPVVETCDGRDNDCDGKIDESLPSTTCTTSGLGACKDGMTSCFNGATVCLTGRPRTEICRDGIDNDCDGTIDEICGIQNNYVVVNSNPSILRSYPTSLAVTKVSTGIYRLSGSIYPCTGRPIFVAAQTSVMRPISFFCDGSNYLIRIGSEGATSSASLQDVGFSAVFPYHTTDSIQARVDVATCPNDGQTCALPLSYGGPSVKRVAKGKYEITAPGCADSGRPIFASLFAGSTVGYISAATNFGGTGKCVVFTTEFKGTLTAYSFAFWLPPKAGYPWALIDGNANLTASYDFGDQYASWSASKLGLADDPYFTAVYPAWRNPSGVLLTPRAGRTCLPPSLGGACFDNYAYSAGFVTSASGITSHNYHVPDRFATTPSTKKASIPFQVLFAQ